MALPPGSVFKVLSAVALLESRRIDPDVRYDCRGYLDKPDRLRCLVFTQQGVGHGLVDLGDALSRSCNVYFFHAAGVMGPQPIVEWARRFGIGRPTGVDLPFEHSGNLPEPDATASGDGRKSSGAAWHIADTRALAIGQSSLTVTPLQIARVMAAIANGGYLVTPFVARKAGPQLADDESDLSFSRRQPIPGLSEGTLARIRAALVNVVARPTGTGYKTVRAKEIAIAGKTGTAQVSAGQADHAWFAGYAPADKPRIAFAVVLEHAGSGGKAAGPVARQLVEAFLADGVLEPARITMRE
jgi:penicillin-binding protein 2